jgi:hypothetical protein
VTLREAIVERLSGVGRSGPQDRGAA